MITNKQFAAAVGCDYTTASRLRSGARIPSTRLLNRICTAYDLPRDQALKRLEEDEERGDGVATSFAAWLRAAIFGSDDEQDLARTG